MNAEIFFHRTEEKICCEYHLGRLLLRQCVLCRQVRCEVEHIATTEPLPQENYVAPCEQKSKTFTKSNMHSVLMYASRSGDPEDTLMGVGVALIHYGLLRCVNVLNINVEDVKVAKGESVKVTFEHHRKRVNPGFKFHVPIMYLPLFERYMTQLNPYAKKSPGSSRTTMTKLSFAVRILTVML